MSPPLPPPTDYSPPPSSGIKLGVLRPVKKKKKKAEEEEEEEEEEEDKCYIYIYIKEKRRREKIVKGDQMTVMRYQTEGWGEGLPSERGKKSNPRIR